LTREVNMVRHGREHEPQRAEPLEWPPKRREWPPPERKERPQRREDAPRRKREKVPG